MEEQIVIPKGWCHMAMTALDAAYYCGRAFNVVQFAEMVGKPVPDRHVRGVLNLLVRAKRLKRENLLHSDGHYRLVYSARISPRQIPMPL